MIHSSFHDEIQFKGLFNIIFSGIFNSKNCSITFFPESSIKKLIKKFEFCFIDFKKIFNLLENQGIEHHYHHYHHHHCPHNHNHHHHRHQLKANLQLAWPRKHGWSFILLLRLLSPICPTMAQRANMRTRASKNFTIITSEKDSTISTLIVFWL